MAAFFKYGEVVFETKLADRDSVYNELIHLDVESLIPDDELEIFVDDVLAEFADEMNDHVNTNGSGVIFSNIVREKLRPYTGRHVDA